MPMDTTYFSSLRHPFSQLKSHLHYTHQDVGIGDHDPVELFMKSKATKTYKGAEFLRIPKEFTKSSMTMDIYGRSVLKRIPLSIISEHFDESLIILKRQLCWDLEDIIYVPLKVGDYQYKSKYKPGLLQKHKEMFKSHYSLFDRYNETLWDAISLTENFDEELAHFRSVLEKVYHFCGIIKQKMLVAIKRNKVGDILESDEELIIRASKWNNEFRLDTMDCLISYMDKRVMRGIFIQRQSPGKSKFFLGNNSIIGENQLNNIS